MSVKGDDFSQEVFKEVEWKIILPRTERWRLRSPEFAFRDLKYRLWLYVDYSCPRSICAQFDILEPTVITPLRVIQWQVGVQFNNKTSPNWTEVQEIPVLGENPGWRLVDKWKIFNLSTPEDEKDLDGPVTIIMRLSEGQLPSEQELNALTDVPNKENSKKAVEENSRNVLTSDTDTSSSESSKSRQLKRKRSIKKISSTADDNDNDSDMRSKRLPLPPSNSLSEVIDVNDDDNETHSLHSQNSDAEIDEPTLSTNDCDETSLNGPVKFQKIVLQKLNEIIHNVKKIENRLDRLEDKSKTLNLGIIPDNKYTKLLPLGTESDVLEMERSLKKEGIDDLVNILRPIGGSDDHECIVRILERILSNNVAEQYSWTGAKGKKMFRNLFLVKAIFNAAKSHRPYLTEKSVETIISNWLKYAKQRRMRREEKKNKSYNIC